MENISSCFQKTACCNFGININHGLGFDGKHVHKCSSACFESTGAEFLLIVILRPAFLEMGNWTRFVDCHHQR
jgi:hypothetical protein